MNKPKRKVAMLDRDGVLNKNRGYVGFKKDFKWIKGAKETIKKLKQLKFYVAVITKQSGVARKFFKYRDVQRLHAEMQKDLSKINTKIDAFYFSPYHIDGIVKKYKINSSCRKPGIKLFKRIQKKFNVEKKSSFMIGDQKTDMIFAKRCGVKGYFFKNGNLLSFIKKKKIIS